MSGKTNVHLCLQGVSSVLWLQEVNRLKRALVHLKINSQRQAERATLTSSAHMLIECQIRVVKTNIPVLLNVLTQPEFEMGMVTTAFIDKNPQLKRVSKISCNFDSNKQSDQRKVKDLERCASFINAALSNAFSANMWGGAIFDVARIPCRSRPPW